MMEVLRAQLLTGEEGVELVAFFESCPSRSAMICALLAVLELVRLQAIVLTQKEIFGSITLRKHKMFDVVFAGGEFSASVKTPHSIDGSTATGEPKPPLATPRVRRANQAPPPRATPMTIAESGRYTMRSLSAKSA